jgi:diaminopimelate epimerase
MWNNEMDGKAHLSTFSMGEGRAAMNEKPMFEAWENKEFFKMSGSGNDFIFIDNLDGEIQDPRLSDHVALLCRRRTSIGADGLFLIERSASADFKWRFFNSDGSEAEMCGNGGRCAARFAHMKGIAGTSMSFETGAGLIHATVIGSQRVKLQMTDPFDIQLDYELDMKDSSIIVSHVNTGVPHVVAFVDSLDTYPVLETGRAIRCHDRYKPAGTNADFVHVLAKNEVEVRTYERGVEDETLACGTGAVAAAVIAAGKGLVSPPVSVRTRGGERLLIHFSTDKDVGGVYLEGDVRFIYKGRIQAEAFLA